MIQYLTYNQFTLATTQYTFLLMSQPFWLTSWTSHNNHLNQLLKKNIFNAVVITVCPGHKMVTVWVKRSRILLTLEIKFTSWVLPVSCYFCAINLSTVSTAVVVSKLISQLPLAVISHVMSSDLMAVIKYCYSINALFFSFIQSCKFTSA